MNGLTVSENGVYLAGSTWGEPNAGNQAGRLTDHNGDGVYEGTFEIITGSSLFTLIQMVMVGVVKKIFQVSPALMLIILMIVK